MKKTVLSLTLAASVLALSACGNASDEKVATSKVGDVTKDQLYKEMKDSVGDSALQLIIIEKVLSDKYKVSDKAVSAEYKKQKEQMESQGQDFKQALAAQNMTEKSFKRSVKLNLLQEAALADGVKVSEADMKAYYEEMKKEVKASHILVADEKTAKEVKAKLDKGEDFAKLAKKYSTDTGSQAQGGELGWFGPDKMVPEFTKAAYALKKGEISEPVKSSYGYHIIKLEDERDAKVKGSYEDNKAEIKKKLQLQEADQSQLLTKVSKLIKDADVKIKDDDLKDALAQFKSSSK
ncbi:peptidylprolyl isomerase [uncultured Rummeliibacillus sp.]|uniref:peptidylprolyl isomerase n=1 Tax=uncultured Rummeliibacillus sp. TaxID=762292 RepID=UPI00260877BA|nr:peptidylprolyl isomerase [uncultured Rummeliibacillus sp.]